MKKIYLWLFLLTVSATTFSQRDYPTNETGNNSAATGVALSNFDASQGFNGVQLIWVATGETNMLNYEIEKSVNGSPFTTIGSLTARNAAAPHKYSFSDGTPVEGVNYYRVRSTGKQGDVTYSKAIAVDNSYRKTDLQVIPNPVVNGTINLQMKNFDAGKYFVTVLTSAGQRVFAQSFDVSEGAVTKIINLPQSVARGMYVLQLTNSETRINKQVVIQ